VILLCADHGDMLGERGLWFKMSFFEDSIRVPLWLHAPQRFSARAPAEPVSTLDVLATLIDLAGGTIAQEELQTDGCSLLPLAAGGSTLNRPVFAEYAAEGSVDPMVLIRDGVWKFKYCAADPPQLFNLQDDPHELHNLAADGAYADTVARFTARLQARCDIGRFRDEVLLSQARRLLVYDALRRGEYQSWDYQPLQRASERYMRNHMDLNVLEATARYPHAGD
jgi:choline-sulfatase